MGAHVPIPRAECLGNRDQQGPDRVGWGPRFGVCGVQSRRPDSAKLTYHRLSDLSSIVDTVRAVLADIAAQAGDGAGLQALAALGGGGLKRSEEPWGV